jgi:hypothetical protein
MDEIGILFSARDPEMVDVDDAIAHLKSHSKLYWEVMFPIIKDQFRYPIKGYIHICGRQVEYVAEIEDIIPFSRSHYEDESSASKFKPQCWIDGWKADLQASRNMPWKNALIMTSIKPFRYDTYKFKMLNGKFVTHPPQKYIRVFTV